MNPRIETDRLGEQGNQALKKEKWDLRVNQSEEQSFHHGVPWLPFEEFLPSSL